jgi:hypothetical protein
MLIRVGKSEAFGCGGLAVAVLVGALASGFRGAMIMSGLFGLVVGVVAVARGRVSWARLENRAWGGAMLSAALVVLVAGLLAPASTKPPQTFSAVPAPSAQATATTSPKVSAPAPATTVAPHVPSATIAPPPKPAPPAVPTTDPGMSAAHQPSGGASDLARSQPAPTAVQLGLGTAQCKDKTSALLPTIKGTVTPPWGQGAYK